MSPVAAMYLYAGLCVVFVVSSALSPARALVVGSVVLAAFKQHVDNISTPILPGQMVRGPIHRFPVHLMLETDMSGDWRK